jgi:SRSO17 transposase
MQHLLSRACWDDAGVQADLRAYVLGAFGDPAGILVIDETGDVKKGELTVGVQRQYTGTAGRIENAQVAVYLTYTGPAGHALIDRALYLPKSWIDDPGRCAAAGVPDDVQFATKPALALALTMIDEALAAGATASWVAGDEVYGNNPALRAGLRQRGVGLRAGRALRSPDPDQRRTGPRRQRGPRTATGLPAAAVRRGRFQGPPGASVSRTASSASIQSGITAGATSAKGTRTSSAWPPSYPPQVCEYP